MSDTTEDLHHAPTCTRPGTTIECGHSVDITKCTGCGALSTTRHGATTTPLPEVTP